MAPLRRIANRSKDYVLFNPWLESYWLTRARGRIAALLYHQVDTPARNAFLAKGGSPVITETQFRRELQFLRTKGARFFTFDEIIAGIYPNRDEFGVAVCFDDCFLNNYTLGLDILDELGIKATFFQSTAMIDSVDLLWEHRLYWHTRDAASSAEFRQVALEVLTTNSRVPPLALHGLVEFLREDVPFETCERVLATADASLATRGEMEKMARQIYPNSDHLRQARSRGHVIGSHGHHHYKRANISAAMFEHELVQSRSRLEQVLGERPACFSYPFDSYVPTDADICRKYYSGAATVAKRAIERDADRMWLPRFTWPGVSGNEFRLRRWLLSGTI
jgi:peptidoglycan/xylan/chitin deacetylase (PgdA/CDA1 family)